MHLYSHTVNEPQFLDFCCKIPYNRMKFSIHPQDRSQGWTVPLSRWTPFRNGPTGDPHNQPKSPQDIYKKRGVGGAAVVWIVKGPQNPEYSPVH